MRVVARRHSPGFISRCPGRVVPVPASGDSACPSESSRLKGPLFHCRWWAGGGCLDPWGRCPSLRVKQNRTGAGRSCFALLGQRKSVLQSNKAGDFSMRVSACSGATPIRRAWDEPSCGLRQNFSVVSRGSSKVAGGARLLVGVCLVALNGGPSLVIGCCGSPWAADRPPCGRFPALLVVSGRGPCRAVGVPPGKGFLGCFFFGWFAAVDDDLLNLARGVAPRDELVQVVPVALERGPP